MECSSTIETNKNAINAENYFSHPYASWEQGIKENTNGLILQYFPKGTDFSDISDDEIKFVMNRLNNQPCASCGGRSLNELFLGQWVDLLIAIINCSDNLKPPY